MDYDEFGKVIQDTAPGFQPFGFAGGIYDRDTRLTKLGFRDYDRQPGRWTVEDRLGFGAGNPNLYGYVFNDPVNFVDLEGLLPRWLQNRIPPHILEQVRQTVQRLSNNAFTQQQLNALTQQVLDTLGLPDALRFRNVDPTRDPLEITKRQNEALEKLLGNLNEKYPDDPNIEKLGREFKRAKELGRCVVK